MKAKTVGLAIRENIIEQIQKRINSSSVYFFVGFNNVKSSALSKLRNELRVVDSYVFVAKNSLIHKAVEDLKLKNLKDYLQGETGIISVYNEDIVKPCKAIVEFTKENETFIIKGGIIEGRKISREELEALAKLPSREVLLGQALSGLASPLTGFLACLNQIILKFVWVAEEIKKVKTTQGKDQKKPESQEAESQKEKKQEDKPQDKKEEQEDKKEEKQNEANQEAKKQKENQKTEEKQISGEGPSEEKSKKEGQEKDLKKENKESKENKEPNKGEESSAESGPASSGEESKEG